MGVDATQERDGWWEVRIRALIGGTIYCERRWTQARNKAAALAWGERRRKRLLAEGPNGEYEPPPMPTPAGPPDDELWQIWLFQNNPCDVGWVYFVAGPNWAIKIGWAQDVEDRVAGLQIGCPSELTILGVMRGDRPQEALAHRHFAEHRLRGEWFAPGEDLMRFIADHAQPWQPDGTPGSREAEFRYFQRENSEPDAESPPLRSLPLREGQ